MMYDRVEKKSVNASVYTSNRLKIEGTLFHAKAVRLIDDMNLKERDFIPVSQATVTSLDNPEFSDQGIVLLNKREVVCIVLNDADAGLADEMEM